MHQHTFIPSDKKDYEVCTECGSYHSINQTDPETIYEKSEYWSYEEKRSKPDEQIKNLNETEGTGISKVDIVIKYIPSTAKVVCEAGCFPGEVLRRLKLLGHECWGVEPAEKYIDFIKNQSGGANIIKGYFPDVFDPKADNIFDAMIFQDVFEHVNDGEGFIAAVHRLLKPGGVAVFMSPIIFEDGLFRFRDFKNDEHCWIYTKEFLKPYLEEIFSDVKWDRWVNGHEMFIVYK